VLINWANGESWLFSDCAAIDDVPVLLELLELLLWSVELRIDCK
jgi:hypothetical protein